MNEEPDLDLAARAEEALGPSLKPPRKRNKHAASSHATSMTRYTRQLVIADRHAPLNEIIAKLVAEGYPDVRSNTIRTLRWDTLATLSIIDEAEILAEVNALDAVKPAVEPPANDRLMLLDRIDARLESLQDMYRAMSRHNAALAEQRDTNQQLLGLYSRIPTGQRPLALALLQTMTGDPAATRKSGD